VPDTLENLKNIVKNIMSTLEGTAHSYKHVERVLQIATFLALEEKADVELVQVGTVLHDVGWALSQPHNETGAKLARKILESIGYPQEKTAKVLNIILRHPLEFRDRLETLEEKVVWDADKIDLLGAIGIARAFHWGGKRPFETVVTFCVEEGLPIYSLLNTAAARKIAATRYNETTAFLSALEEELSVKDLIMS
jgi:putative nucleotidyltransferase with HDIG domain